MNSIILFKIDTITHLTYIFPINDFVGPLLTNLKQLKALIN